MNFAIQCTDVLTGKKGTFGFDTDEYLNADEPDQFKAKTPIFDGMDQLFAWAEENEVELCFVPVSWSR